MLIEEDFDSLADTRNVLEQYAIELVCINASDDELIELELIHKKFVSDVTSGNLGFDKDLVFHLKIAALSKNTVLNSVLTKLLVNMITLFQNFETNITDEQLSGRLHDAIQDLPNGVHFLVVEHVECHRYSP